MNTSRSASAPAQPHLFTAPADWAFPRLGKRAVPDGARVDADSDATSWTAFDTDRRDLERSGASLTRRAAGHWRLRLDGIVTTAEGTARAVPASLRDLLLGLRAGAPLRRIADGSTELTTRVVVDADDRVLGEVDDVRYRSTSAGSADDGAGEAAQVITRRIEVIAVEAGFGAAVRRRLIKAGARPLEPSSASPGTVGEAVVAHLREQRAVLLRGDVRLRRGAAIDSGADRIGSALAAVHPTRVAIRRLRSVLRVVAVLDPERVTALDAELSWFSRLLGDVRDLQVLRAHLTAAVQHARDDAPAEQPTGAPPVAVALEAAGRVIDAALDTRLVAARTRLATAMRGRRYVALLQDLAAWEDAPPLGAAADADVRALRDYALRAARAERKRRRQATDIESRHRARKAAKRTRYVSEFAAGPLSGKRAEQLRGAAKKAKQRQTRLGDRQDAAMAADFLAEVAAQSAGVAAFGCGVLWSAQQDQAATP